MKTLVILILIVLLMAGAFLSRPSQASFNQYITAQTKGNDTNVLKVGWDQYKAGEFVKSCTFHDRLLWTDVEQNGQTIYTGAFGQWFKRGQTAAGRS